MDIPLDEALHFDAVTSDATGAAVDADSTPTWAVFEEATDTPIQTGNFTKRTALDGEYRGTVTLSAANGFEVGKWYHVKGYATVDTVAGKAVVLNSFRIVPAETLVGSPLVTLADGVEHGGTTASLRLGSSSGPGLHVTSSATSSAAVYIENLANLSNGLFIQSGSGDAVEINSANAHGIEIMGLSGVFEMGLAAAIQAEVADALNAYDPPTNAEMEARTLAAASYATAAALATAQTAIDAIPTNAELATALDPLPTAAENAAAILAAGDVDGYSLEEAIKLCLAALVGKLSGAATATIVIRAADDSKARITATVDVDGNRSAVTLDETG